ncbi:MAG: bifunctional heptose 7-phosphate kinase/heptose 1-phosphate adenyltransferase [Chloroflexota bacterium]
MNDRAARLHALLSGFAGRRVLVVGDVMLDEYLIGAPSRVSREAPVLVLEQQRRFVRPGGGANPAVNLQSLGAMPRLIGVIGDDDVGAELGRALSALGMSDADLVTDHGAESTRKTRILAETASSNGQQLLRVDRLGRAPSPTAQLAIEASIHALAEEVDAILISDYKGGAISPSTVDAARRAARSHGKLLSVDSQGELDRFHGFDLVKCNRPDAEAFLGRALESNSDYADAGMSLARELDIGWLMITLGADGIAVSSPAQFEHVPATNRTEVFDVAGAGDTVVAVATLALVCDGSGGDAAVLANLAAGQVVRKLGVATTTVPELRDLLAEL